jgi:hypothetical protein
MKLSIESDCFIQVLFYSIENNEIKLSLRLAQHSALATGTIFVPINVCSCYSLFIYFFSFYYIKK